MTGHRGINPNIYLSKKKGCKSEANVVSMKEAEIYERFNVNKWSEIQDKRYFIYYSINFKEVKRNIEIF